MRIPFYITIPSSLLIVLIVWWINTRHIDFLTPPSEAKLEEIRKRTIASLPISRTRPNTVAVITPKPNNIEQSANDPSVVYPGIVDIGDLSPPKSLDTYSERAPDGAGKLLKLAAELEKLNSLQRALLAYERVLDLSQGNPRQIYLTLHAIRRIRPSLPAWNENAKASHPIVIHIGTGQRFAKELPEIMESITQELHLASSGLIQFSTKINIGESISTNDAPTPVAIWITGGDKSSPSTDALSFASDNPETLRKDLLKIIFNLIRGQLSNSTSYNPAPEVIDNVQIALASNFTRLLWNEFGKNLNPPPKEP
jgi:hypothetical protein